MRLEMPTSPEMFCAVTLRKPPKCPRLPKKNSWLRYAGSKYAHAHALFSGLVTLRYWVSSSVAYTTVSKKIFSGSKYPINILFNFEKVSTGYEAWGQLGFVRKVNIALIVICLWNSIKTFWGGFIVIFVHKKFNDFWGDLPDISAKTTTPVFNTN